MTTPYEEILKILADIEKKNNIPNNTLKKIYELESSNVHFRSRKHIYNTLQGLISEAATK